MPIATHPIYVIAVAPILFCWGLEKLLSTAALELRIVATAQDLPQALQAVQTVHAHVMVVLGHDDPDPALLQKLAATLPVLLLTSGRTDANRALALAAHVVTLAQESASPGALLRAIERTSQSRSRRAFPSHFPLEHDTASDPDQIKISRLTARERKLIAALLCSDSEPGKVIANRLCISEHTLRNHLSSIYGKLGVHNRLGLHTFAARYGLYRLAS